MVLSCIGLCHEINPLKKKKSHLEAIPSCCRELTVDDSNSLLWIDGVYSDSGVRGTKVGDDQDG